MLPHTTAGFVCDQPFQAVLPEHAMTCSFDLAQRDRHAAQVFSSRALSSRPHVPMPTRSHLILLPCKLRPALALVHTVCIATPHSWDCP